MVSKFKKAFSTFKVLKSPFNPPLGKGEMVEQTSMSVQYTGKDACATKN